MSAEFDYGTEEWIDWHLGTEPTQKEILDFVLETVASRLKQLGWGEGNYVDPAEVDIELLEDCN